MLLKMNDILQHYASKYYDPVKAHDYYMRTRELKGRRSTAALNKENKQKWKYVKSNIMAERKQQLDNIRTTKTTEIKNFRTSLKTKITSITAALKTKLESLKNKPRILKKVPKGASERIRARIVKENAQIKEQNQKDKEKNAETKVQLRSDAGVQKTTIRTAVNKSIADAQAKFVQKKADTVKKYLQILDDEYNKILDDQQSTAARADNVSKMTAEEQRAYRNEQYKKRNKIK